MEPLDRLNEIRPGDRVWIPLSAVGPGHIPLEIGPAIVRSVDSNGRVRCSTKTVFHVENGRSVRLDHYRWTAPEWAAAFDPADVVPAERYVGVVQRRYRWGREVAADWVERAFTENVSPELAVLA